MPLYRTCVCAVLSVHAWCVARPVATASGTKPPHAPTHTTPPPSTHTPPARPSPCYRTCGCAVLSLHRSVWSGQWRDPCVEPRAGPRLRCLQLARVHARVLWRGPWRSRRAVPSAAPAAAPALHRTPARPHTRPAHRPRLGWRRETPARSGVPGRRAAPGAHPLVQVTRSKFSHRCSTPVGLGGHVSGKLIAQ